MLWHEQFIQIAESRLASPIAGLTAVLFAGSVQARHHHPHNSGPFDYYLLSLSWAPTYGLTHADDGAECSGKGYGFVLHGLWPQYDGGGYPENCSTQSDLSSEAIAKGRTIYPSERLMQHERREHGTCSGLDALSHFNTADRATAVVKIPAATEAPKAEQSLPADQIAALFLSANPQLPQGALTVSCNRDQLSEIRACLTKDLPLRSCGRDVRSNCPHVPLRVPASRS
ncbi:MAG: ribonuclease [Fimbriimonadales bacterium]